MIQVMFVDDDRVTLKLVKGILEGAGYSVILCTEPQEALQRLEKEQVDIIISDANMPGGISGFDFVKHLRSRPGFMDLPIALLTGRREKRDIQLGLQVGADDYIIKPIDPVVLLGKIETLLKKRSPASPVKKMERPVKVLATWDVDTLVVQVSDKGMVLWSSISPAVEAKVKIRSEVFTQIGIASPALRVVAITKDPNHPSMNFVSVSFVGMPDADQQKLRAWLCAGLNEKAS